MESEPVWPDNQLYDRREALIYYQDAFLAPYRGWTRHIMAEARFHDLRANLAYFAALYADLQAERYPLEWWQRHAPDLASSAEFTQFYERFYAIVDHEAVQVRVGLAALQTDTQRSKAE